MVSESSMDCDKRNIVAEQPVVGSLRNKKNQGKVPKKIHKSEREKLKRDQLNELFLELGHALEPARQNIGKASILGDATRILRDLIQQVQSLRKENVALVKETSYRAKSAATYAGVNSIYSLQPMIYEDTCCLN